MFSLAVIKSALNISAELQIVFTADFIVVYTLVFKISLKSRCFAEYVLVSVSGFKNYRSLSGAHIIASKILSKIRNYCVFAPTECI